MNKFTEQKNKLSNYIRNQHILCGGLNIYLIFMRTLSGGYHANSCDTDEEWKPTKVKFLEITELVCIKADLDTQRT